MRIEGNAVVAGGGLMGAHVPLPTAPRPNRTRPRREPVIVLQPLTRAQERALERGADQPSRHFGRPGEVTDAETQRFIDAYRAGDSLKQIGRDTGRSHVTIRKHLEAAGVPIRGMGGPRPGRNNPPSQGLPPEASQQIADLYSGGASITDIQRQTGRSKDAIRRHIRLHGLEFRPRGAPAVVVTDTERELMIAAYERLGSVHKVGRTLHRHETTIRAVLDEAGLTRTKRGRFEPITDQERTRILQLASEGLTNAAIAARIGRGRTAVGYVVKEGK